MKYFFLELFINFSYKSHKMVGKNGGKKYNYYNGKIFAFLIFVPLFLVYKHVIDYVIIF